jgi:phage terminase large subunit-like protein
VSNASVIERKRRGLVPYSGWVELGALVRSGNEVIDYDDIENCIIEVRNTYDLQAIGYDTWNSSQISKNLEEQDVMMTPFIQGPKSYHPAMKALEEAYISGNFVYGKDPVLTWCASNIVARLDPNENMAPDKKKSADKIDDMVALLMAVGTMLQHEDESLIYDEREIMVL